MNFNTKEIEKLLSDEQFLYLQKAQNQTGIFDIVGQTHTEHWHSAFLCWLFSPGSDHGLGSYPLERLFFLYMEKSSSNTSKATPFSMDEYIKMPFEHFTFETEHPLKGKGSSRGSIDIFAENEKAVLIIENKVDASENMRTDSNKGQTEVYYEHFRSIKKKNVYYFFIAGANQTPADDHFVCMTYQDIYDHVILKCYNHPNLNQEAKYLIKHYIRNLRRKSKKTGKPLAFPDKLVCEQLYTRYESIFTGIMNATQQQNGSDTFEFKFYQKYQEVLDEIFLAVKNQKPATTELNGEALLTYLFVTNKIKVNDEFIKKTEDGYIYEADVMVDNNGRVHLIAGVFDTNNELHEIFDKNGEYKQFYSFNQVISAVVAKHEELSGKKKGNSYNSKKFWERNGTLLKDII